MHFKDMTSIQNFKIIKVIYDAVTNGCSFFSFGIRGDMQYNSVEKETERNWEEDEMSESCRFIRTNLYNRFA